MKKRIISILLAFVISPAFAEEAETTVKIDVQIEQQAQTAEIAPTKSASALVEESYQDWFNNAQEKRTEYCEEFDLPESSTECDLTATIVYGDADVQVSKSNPQWVEARTLAYSDALLNAFAKYAQNNSLNNSVNTLRKLIKDPTPPLLKTSEIKSTYDSLIEKTLALTGGFLDKKLQELGVDSAKYNKALPSEKKKMLEDSISEESIAQSIADTSGMIPVQTFEGNDDKGQYKIRVVISTKPSRVELAREILKNGAKVLPDASKKSSKTISNQLKLPPEVLFNNLGVRLFYDKQGYPILVSFGQASVQQGSFESSERSIARKTANINAVNALTKVLNSSTQTHDITKKVLSNIESEQITLNEDGSTSNTKQKEQKILQSLDSTIKNNSQIKNFQGAREIKSWTYNLPNTNQEVVGSILMWSPITAKQAQQSTMRSSSMSSKKEYKDDTKTKPKVNKGIESNDNDF